MFKFSNSGVDSMKLRTKRTLVACLFTVAFAGGLSATPTDDAKKAACIAAALAKVPGVTSIVAAINKCESTACNGNMTKPQCAVAIASITGCIAFQEFYSSCVDPSGPDGAHVDKIKNWYKSLQGCVTKCGANVANEIVKSSDDVAKQLAKNLADDAAKATGKKVLAKRILSKVLGPIGVAYTVGEIGAYGIKTYGDYNAGQMEKKFACDSLPKVKSMQDDRCNAWGAAKSKFESRFCSIAFDSTNDNCGPKKVSKFESSPSCDGLNLTDSEADLATQFFQQAGSAYVGCMSGVRLYNYYFKVCNGLPGC